MATQPSPQQPPDNKTHLAPYCSDPNCESCKQLRQTQEAIRLHQPLPRKGEKEGTR